ncbi:hypothetical protein GQ43DRAFT_467879 [Delitschia confertaspora ATCC 74209]|uniref:Tetratricopeptide repeat protein n=1 Tax=Delitschia confertaspora ATCC 74209 TaxID=1513339 RepID=A0A9P4N3F1_9PLEO|nr:hypothetical protein GQ43DRAFT_467879 [Delitschia confertaspora ATCC 74209]
MPFEWSTIGAAYFYEGRWKDAEELDMRVMGIRKRVLGEEHPDTLTSMGNLASTYRNQGRWKELDMEVMETKKRDQGRWKEAEELDLRVTETRESVIGEERPDTLTSIANLASTYRNQGQWKEAEELFVRVIETRKRVLGREHPDTISAMNNLDEQTCTKSYSMSQRRLRKRC